MRKGVKNVRNAFHNRLTRMKCQWRGLTYFGELLTGRPRTRQKNIITLGLRILVDFVPLSDPIAFRVAQNTALLSDERINLASALSFWAGGVWVGPNILKYYVRADILKIISFPNHPTIKYPHSVFNISTLLSIKIQKILNQFSPNP